MLNRSRVLRITRVRHHPRSTMAVRTALSATGPNSFARVWPYNSRTTRSACWYPAVSPVGVPSGLR